MRVLKIVKWGFWLVSILAITAIVAVVVFLINLDISRYRSDIETQLEDVLGRDVELAGEMSLELGLRPYLQISDIIIANPEGDWQSGDNFANVDRLELVVDLRGLLHKKVIIERLLLDGAVLNLEENAAGVRNWDIIAESDLDDDGGDDSSDIDESDSNVAIEDISDVVIEDSVVNYYSAGAEMQSVEIAEVNFDAPQNEELSVEMDVVYRDVAANIDFNGGALSAISDENYPIDLSGNIDSLDFSIEGDASLGGDVSQFDFAYDIEADDYASLLELAAKFGGEASLDDENTVIELSPIKSEGRISGSSENIHIITESLEFGDSKATADLDINLAGAVPSIEGDVNLSVLDISELGGEAESEQASEGGSVEENSETLFPDVALDEIGLDMVNLDISVMAEKVILPPDVEISDVSFDVNLLNGLLDISGIEALWEETSLIGNMAFDSSGSGARGLTIFAHIDGFDYGAWLESRDITDRLRGGIDNVELRFSGEGRSLYQLIEQGSGMFELVAGGGEFETEAIDVVGADLVRLIIPGDRSEMTVINCGVANMNIENGIMHTDNLLIDTENVTLAGEAALEIISGEVNMLIKPHPKSPSLLNLAVPVRVTGRIDDLNAGAAAGSLLHTGANLVLGALNPVTMVVPFVDLGAEENPCVAALENPQEWPAELQSQENPVDNIRDTVIDVIPEDIGDGIGDGLEGVGDVLEGSGDGIEEGLRGLFGR